MHRAHRKVLCLFFPPLPALKMDRLRGLAVFGFPLHRPRFPRFPKPVNIQLLAIDLFRNFLLGRVAG